MAHRKTALVYVALVLMLICTWAQWSEASAERQAEDGLKRALATYAVARGINALISVAQSTQVSVQPAGVGIATNPGEALDPVNDLIEQFSSLMLAASVAFGVQLLLIKAGAHYLVSVALSLVAIAWCVVYTSRHAAPRWLTKPLVLLLLVRFAVPATVIASEQTYQALFEDQYQGSVTILKSAPTNDESATRADLPSTDNRGSKGSWRDWLPPSKKAPAEEKKPADKVDGVVDPKSSWRDWLPSFKKAPPEEKEPADKVDGVVGRMQAFLNDGVKHVVTLAALFVMQTLVLPLVFLWSLLAALRYVGLPSPSIRTRPVV